MTEPDFEIWAKNVLEDSQFNSEIELALKQAYDQGKHLGNREGFAKGYDRGLNYGWSIEQDKDSSVCLTCKGKGYVDNPLYGIIDFRDDSVVNPCPDCER